MTTLNETAATIAGEELGELLYEAIAGEGVQRASVAEPSGSEHSFDYDAEMRETRIGAEELLAQGKIQAAESYMEEHRQVFVEHGYLIRKLNQAYFAFHDTYATTGASTSPIGDQLLELRSYSDSLNDFVRTVAEFGAYQEFLGYLDVRRAEVSAADAAGD